MKNFDLIVITIYFSTNSVIFSKSISDKNYHIWGPMINIKPFDAKIFQNFSALTQHSCKRLPFSRIRFSNFEIFFGLVSWCWCLKYIYIWLSPFGPLYGGPGAPNVPKMTKPGLMYWNHFRLKSPKILCQLAAQLQNFPEFPDNWENWEFFANFGFWNF